MAITASDIKLLASERMTDRDDSGGAMTSTTLQDGVDNNVFPDLTTLARAAGAWQARKVFAAVPVAGTDALMGTHVVLDDAADDTAVSALLVAAGSLVETRAGLISRINAQGAALGYAGIVAVSGALTAGATAVPVASLDLPLLPVTHASSPASGALVAAGSATVTGYVLTDADALISAYAYTTQPPVYAVALAAANHYTLRMAAPLPVQTVRTRVTAANRGLVYTLAIPAGTEVGTESVQVVVGGMRWVMRAARDGSTALAQIGMDSAGSIGGAPGGWVGDFPTVAAPLWGALAGPAAIIDRTAGTITLALVAAPDLGSDIVVGYAQGGSTGVLGSGALSGGGTFGSGHVTVTVTSGRKLAAAVFIAGGQVYYLRDGILRHSSGTVVGTYDATSGVLSAPTLDTLTISEWRAVEVDTSVALSSIACTLPAALDPATLVITGTTVGGSAISVTASAAGVISAAAATGNYDSATGALTLAFTSAVRSGALAYTATQLDFWPALASAPTLTPASLPSSGRVPVFAQGAVVVLQHAADTAPGTHTAGDSISCGRTDLAWAQVIGADGHAVAGGYTVNKATGTVTVLSIAGWAQPVRVRHAIEHVATVGITPTGGVVTLNRALDRDFPAGSTLTSALVLGDLQAAAGAAFSQQTWTDVWQSTRIGAAIAAQYQQVAHPIEVSNAGAVTERWALIFTTPTQFRVVGEQLGQIATGDVNSDLVPVNPGTGSAYFTLRATGWGGGWAAGNVLRFDTTGACAGFWALRVTQPSTPDSTADSVTLSIRGDINT